MLTWLKDVRVGTGLSQIATAKNIGISQQHYNFIESGERRPSVETAKKIAKELNFDWRLFFPDEPTDNAEMTA